ncbi:hypothetical protein QZH41_020564 [Actinostola sp. cb2023]|nr:hypothetical protein QZH41_020564 [Actinostola sp. cb2023]
MHYGKESQKKMSSSCIHVTALLFRVEAANRNGLTNPACTSKQCVWNVPADKTVVQPKRICDMDWKTSKLNKKPSRPAFDKRRSLFEPAEKKLVNSEREKRAMLYKGLKDVVPDSTFVMMNNAEHQEDEYHPLSELNDSAVLTEEQIRGIELTTVGQAANPAWHTQRKGRITASNFYKVKTKVETLKTPGNNANAHKLVDSLLGHSAPPENVPALKYGREMEQVAKNAYIKVFEKNHKNSKHRECGLFIDDHNQYLGASPDLLLECSCCEKGVLEIKCPLSAANEIPTPDNLTYLVSINDQVTLKKKHQYYAQIQGQMAIAKRDWCHFLVYTQKGYHLETIQFDEDYWLTLLDSLTWFYVHHLAPAIFKSYRNNYCIVQCNLERREN